MNSGRRSTRVAGLGLNTGYKVDIFLDHRGRESVSLSVCLSFDFSVFCLLFFLSVSIYVSVDHILFFRCFSVYLAIYLSVSRLFCLLIFSSLSIYLSFVSLSIYRLSLYLYVIYPSVFYLSICLSIHILTHSNFVCWRNVLQLILHS